VSVFDELKGYSGWVVLEAEQDPKKAPPALREKGRGAHPRRAEASGVGVKAYAARGLIASRSAPSSRRRAIKS
jgi:hypothetical protein